MSRYRGTTRGVTNWLPASRSAVVVALFFLGIFACLARATIQIVPPTGVLKPQASRHATPVSRP